MLLRRAERPAAATTTAASTARHPNRVVARALLGRRGGSNSNNNQSAAAAAATTTTTTMSASRADGAPSAAAGADGAPSAAAVPTLLAIGATGPTGRCAINGLIAAGVPAASILALTRSESGAGARALAERGVALAAADLDAGAGADADAGAESVASVLARLPSLRAVYIHALSADAASADPRELERARRLARQLPPPLDLVIYNSSAGRGAGAGVSQMEQKHACEDALRAGCAGASVPFLALQPAMFYEELWKRYTRPSVLQKGRFPFSVPPDVPVHLVAARDLGTAAAAALADPARYAAMGALPLAGDALTPAQLCAAFERAAREAVEAGAAGAAGAESKQPVATTVTQSRPPAWLFWILNRDLYRIVRFLSKPPGYGVDVAAARAAVPGLLPFAAFLRATGWADPSRSYEQGVRYAGDDDEVMEAAAGREGTPPVPSVATAD